MTMRISDVKVFPIWGGNRNYLVVKIETDAGIYGIGESGLTWCEMAVKEIVLALREKLIGQDPTRKEHLWQVMFRGGFFPGAHALSAAISAIDIALWDLLGKALGCPVYDLLGGPVRDSVPVYANAWFAGCRQPDEFAAAAIATVAEGHDAIKFDRRHI